LPFPQAIGEGRAAFSEPDPEEGMQLESKATPCASGRGGHAGTCRRMILGIGTDLANIERIQRALDRFGDRFRNRVFTVTEQNRAERMKDPAATYAKRWAAKEACSKALGTGLRMGIAWKDMAVTNLSVRVSR
jgi:hypothetical protein